jgi:peptidoglycan/LPS O-acetylase OafA/YrhL
VNRRGRTDGRALSRWAKVLLVVGFVAPAACYVATTSRSVWLAGALFGIACLLAALVLAIAGYRRDLAEWRRMMGDDEEGDG